MDVLTDVLKVLRLTSRLYSRSELRAPWGIEMPPARRMAFHVVDRGGAWLRREGEGDLTALAAGDLVVLPHGGGHQLVDHPSTLTQPLIELSANSSGCPRLQLGGSGPATSLVCGYFQLEEEGGWEDHPLVPLLPGMIHVKGEDGRKVPWLEATLRFLADEAGSGRPGTDAVVHSLTAILFVQVLRAWLEHDGIAPGWLGALRDPQMGRALTLLHTNPERGWTTATLAAGVNMSRSAFAARFTALVGEPPLTYLTRWRMRLAAGLLREDVPLTEVAERVGYESEAAFSVAFKRERGVPPGQYRRSLPPSATRKEMTERLNSSNS